MARIVKVSKKNTIRIPKEIAETLGISEGTLLELRVEGNKLIAIPIRDPFWLALYRPKYAKTAVDELESVSEEEQKEAEDAS